MPNQLRCHGPIFCKKNEHVFIDPRHSSDVPMIVYELLSEGLAYLTVMLAVKAKVKEVLQVKDVYLSLK